MIFNDNMFMIKMQLVPTELTYRSGLGVLSYSRVSQSITKRNRQIPKYTSTQEIRDQIIKAVWTEDPFGGKLDLLKHASFMQESVEAHPDYSGDCEDFANYWIYCLLKNKIASEAYMGVAHWYSSGQKKILGHAFCIYKTDQWYGVSNFNKHTPFEVGQKDSDWVMKFEQNRTDKVLLAAKFGVYGPDDDGCVIYSKSYVQKSLW